jgi:hypothetical protein
MGAMTFTDFKKDFYSRVKDLSIFDCEDFNLLKVVLDGLKVRYTDKGTIRTYMFYPGFVYSSYLFAQRLRKKSAVFLKRKMHARLEETWGRPFLIIDNGRIQYDESGKPVSSYFHNIINLFGGKCVVVNEKVRDERVAHDFDYSALFGLYALQPLNAEEHKLRLNLIKSYKGIMRSGVFDTYELKNIRIAMDVFFTQYRVWSRFLETHPKLTHAFPVCHYHREGCILALKRKKIEVIELQHGLIACEDIFYIFPEAIKPIRERALFADRMLVYGEFWKKRLEKGYEYPAQNIDVVGYYLYSNTTIAVHVREAIEKAAANKKIILVTTQTFMHDHFMNYVSWLANNIQANGHPYIILVKPHPAERPGLYENLDSLPGVKVMSESIDVLFQFASLHISVYSTTLYDAVRFGVPNYSLWVEEYGDYIRSVIDSGVAQLLHDRESPFDKANKPSGTVSPDAFFAPFDPGKLLKR